MVTKQSGLIKEFLNFTYQELEALQSGLEKKASMSSKDAEFIGLQVGLDVSFLAVFPQLIICVRK